MSFELVTVIRETLGSLSTFAESIEKTIESIKRSSGSISSSIGNRKLRKIADGLAKFYFTPVGIRMDLENYIKNPNNEKLSALESKLEENQEIIRRFSDFVYHDLDRNLFNLPLSDIDYLFGMKSKLHLAIYDSRYEIEALSDSEKKKYLDETVGSFDEFNHKIEQVIKNIIGSIS
jgi:hypothetical protein